MEVKVTITKLDKRSAVLGETITAYIDSSAVNSYLQLVKKTWPSTKIKVNK